MERKSVRSQILEIPLGGQTQISVSDILYSSIRSAASELGLQFGRIYKVHLDRDARIYIVERTK